MPCGKAVHAHAVSYAAKVQLAIRHLIVYINLPHVLTGNVLYGDCRILRGYLQRVSIHARFGVKRGIHGYQGRVSIRAFGHGLAAELKELNLRIGRQGGYVKLICRFVYGNGQMRILHRFFRIVAHRYGAYVGHGFVRAVLNKQPRVFAYALYFQPVFSGIAAAAAVLAGTIGSYLSPGTSHNPFVAKMAGMDVMEFIGTHTYYSLMCGAILVVGTAVVCFLMGDGKGDTNAQVDETKIKNEDFTPNPLKALVPLVPITILVVGNMWVPAIKMGVAQAMLIGAICALLVSLSNPQEFSKKFFDGMGKGYADVLGIIIAAGVFAAGLRATGLIDACVDALKDSNDIARWGGSLGPWIMGVITGSGDAATLAFNETVTPHAKDFGMTIEGLGGLAFLTGALGRTMSPLAGVTILVSGIAMVNPIDVIKRTAIPCIIAVFACAFLMV